MSDFFSIQLEITDEFKSKLVQWANHFDTFTYIDSNRANDLYTNYDFILGIDALSSYSQLDELKEGKFYFGHIGYDFNSPQPHGKPMIDFGNFYFFEPRYIIYAKNGRLYFSTLR